MPRQTDVCARVELTLHSIAQVFGTVRAPALLLHASLAHLLVIHPSGSHQLLTIERYKSPLANNDVVKKLNVQ